MTCGHLNFLAICFYSVKFKLVSVKRLVALVLLLFAGEVTPRRRPLNFVVSNSGRFSLFCQKLSLYNYLRDQMYFSEVLLVSHVFNVCNIDNWQQQQIINQRPLRIIACQTSSDCNSVCRRQKSDQTHPISRLDRLMMRKT